MTFASSPGIFLEMYISGIKSELFSNPYIMTGKDYSASKNYHNVYIKKVIKALRVYAVFKYC